MKYNMSKIMTRAWEIKHTELEVSFSVCLKRAWAEAKAPAYLKGEALYSRLVEMGASRWQKAGRDRLYLNRVAATMAGLEYDSYKTGSVSMASLKGETISNSRASKLLVLLDAMYIDVRTGKMVYTENARLGMDEIVSDIQYKISHIAA